MTSLFYRHMVCPLPDTSANQAGIFFKKLPVISQTTGTISHSMGVFAKEKWAFAVFFPFFLHHIQRIIHSALYIDAGRIIRHIRSLVVHQTRSVSLLRPNCHIFKILSISCLISHRPDDDTREILISLHHTDCSFHHRFFPIWMIGRPVFIKQTVFPHGILRYQTVAFQIRLVHHIHSHFITQFQKTGCRRIMGGTHTVDIQPLHQIKIFFHILFIHHMTLFRMGIMVIHAF